ncbi:unnamed protein product [Prunus armeniaca]|uniref:Reverse transcriptase zinc-binding domain-containing protein n=1 Tax=Prunus armeniaca TaxID=36596 RepID=A0A6J5TYI2_PRUAR|nr:unnamed protein product [Prunus armeniaca]
MIAIFVADHALLAPPYLSSLYRYYPQPHQPSLRGHQVELFSRPNAYARNFVQNLWILYLIHSRITKAIYRSVVDKVLQKLTAWKGKLLSLPGKATLIKSVAASIPLYTMQIVQMPISTCDELDKIDRNFLWGSNGDNLRTYRVNWGFVCISKKKGGLGLKHTALMNQSMLAKVGWRLLQQKDNVWSDSLTKKYLQGNSSSIIRNGRPMSSSPSPTWRAIEHGVDILKNGSVEGVDEGKLQLKVVDYLAHGTWDLHKLKEDLSLGMVAHIICVPTGLCCKPDLPVWKHTSNGSFSVKSAYRANCGDFSSMDVS